MFLESMTASENPASRREITNALGSLATFVTGHDVLRSAPSAMVVDHQQRSGEDERSPPVIPAALNVEGRARTSPCEHAFFFFVVPAFLFFTLLTTKSMECPVLSTTFSGPAILNRTPRSLPSHYLDNCQIIYKMGL
ncbi:hypothetical protein B0T18DRAFT_390392 [Schizothecium vesticola]|uniref:Uncharacterized protein n=1 Tax=Schizothecium vesticola TaxID=314040 RepID=A0AA40EUP9_9PEZI|nr:hypothetical protein B0T18DRAFT_390392 [Schizothecium vesticola]